MDRSDDDGLAVFERARRRLFGIAYRMLGSAHEAEDLVQDVWMRWHAVDREGVREPAAFLATMTTRLALNVLQSARARRESYVGPWLPEPVDTRADPGLGAERGEALSLAVLLLLEKLSPTERAGYVLREAFDYSYREIGDILELEEAHARQLVTRARKHIAAERRAPVSADEQRRLLVAFVDAAQRGDLAALEALLAADAVHYSDGGGRARAARAPIAGRKAVARVIASFASHFWSGVTLTWLEANGRPAVLLVREGAAIALVTIDASAQGIDRALWVLNPDKLSAVWPRPATAPG
jgi:RNA polymerase sigma-70 factor (TIGR02957 family)